MSTQELSPMKMEASFLSKSICYFFSQSLEPIAPLVPTTADWSSGLLLAYDNKVKLWGGGVTDIGALILILLI